MPKPKSQNKMNKYCSGYEHLTSQILYYLLQFDILLTNQKAARKRALD